MKPNAKFTAALLGGALAGIGMGLTAMRLTPTALAAPSLAAAAPVNPLTTMMEGKSYPLTLKAEQIDSSFHLVGLVDTQGQSSLYATRGETITVSGETFWVCYSVPTTNSPVRPPQPKAGATANLIYINMRAVEAVGSIIPIVPPDTSAPTTTPPAAALP